MWSAEVDIKEQKKKKITNVIEIVVGNRKSIITEERKKNMIG